MTFDYNWSSNIAPRIPPIIPLPVIFLFSFITRLFFSTNDCLPFAVFFLHKKCIYFWNMFVWKKGCLISSNEGSSTLCDLLLTFSSHLNRGVLAVSVRRRSYAVWELGNRYDTMPSLCAWPLGAHPLRWWYPRLLLDWSSNPFSWPPAFHPAALKERGKSLSRLIAGK